MARASAEGHRVVLVVATNGAHGEVPDDLAAGETLVDRRRRETEASAETLGVHRIVWLGYDDSGMNGWSQNDHSESFHQAAIDEAAQRVAEVVREEDADVLTIYDWHGGYGHPDHVKIHKVGVRVGELVPRLRIAEATSNRTVIVAMMKQAIESGTMPTVDGDAVEFDPEGPADDGNPFGTPEAEITLAVDVSTFTEVKRAALMCHRSQVSDTSLFMKMPSDRFQQMFGAEWFIEHDVSPPLRWGWLFDIPR